MQGTSYVQNKQKWELTKSNHEGFIDHFQQIITGGPFHTEEKQSLLSIARVFLIFVLLASKVLHCTATDIKVKDIQVLL